MPQVDQEGNAELVQAYSIVLRELAVSKEYIRTSFAYAFSKGDALTVSARAVDILQCEFAAITLACRIACYRKCANDASFSSEFWALVQFN